MWLFWAALAGIFFTAETLTARHVLRNRSDPWAYSFWFSLSGTILTLPWFLSDPTLPHGFMPWFVGIAVGLLIVIYNLAVFKANSLIEPSLSGAIGKLKLVWVFLFGVVFLNTPFSWLKLVGVVLTTAAGAVIVRSFRRPEHYTGVVLIVGGSIVVAAIVILTKQLFEWFNIASITFLFSFLVPAIFNYLLMPRRNQRIPALFKASAKFVALAGLVGVFANISLNAGLHVGEPSAVLVVMEAFLILTFVGEHIVLKERDGQLAKLAAVALAVSGAILIQITS